MSIATPVFQPMPVESRIKRLGRRLSFWWRRETTAADVSNAFHAAAKAHEKYSNNVDSTNKSIREWSAQLGAPPFAPELGNPVLQEFMLEMCAAIKPDATQSQQLNELLTSIAHTFQSLASDETNCKKYVHELMTARKNVDRCRSNSQDSGLLEKSCEHWEERLSASVRSFRLKSGTQLRSDISLLLNHLQVVEPSVHDSMMRIDQAYLKFGKLPIWRAPQDLGSGSPHSPLDSSYRLKCEDAEASSSPLYNMRYQPSEARGPQDQTSVYSGESLGIRAEEDNMWAEDLEQH